MSVDTRRIRPQNSHPPVPGMVLYWMQRDQRVQDNWALLYAEEQARKRGVALCVVFTLVPTFGPTTLRHYDFMLRGLQAVEAELHALNIPFHLLSGEPTETLPAFVNDCKVGEVVTDFNPLRCTTKWRDQVASTLGIAFTVVDAHNIVPCWYASPKEEFAAYTFRPKVVRLLPEFLTPFPMLHSQVYGNAMPAPINWEQLLASVKTDRSVLPVDWLVPGEAAAHKKLEAFCVERLEGYAEGRNDPNGDAQSELSPYLHFGQLSAQRCALAAMATTAPAESREAYLEELIVRRELADNYCFYNSHYDTVAGAHAWAQKTIAEHALDKREYEYSRTQLDSASTHDDLWNAMQQQLVESGKLHGWCRMYWAKKILEWTPDVQTAIDDALYLNDRYELDGTDPSGITGVMWSIAGVHDRAWNERPIFGKIRYMNYAGAKRKFDIKQYIATWSKKPTLWSE